MRVTDPVWLEFLHHLRIGQVQPQDLAMLRGLVLGNKLCPPTNLSVAPWDENILITPRHGVRTQWNESAVRKHCRDKGEMLIMARANDRINERLPSRTEQEAIRQTTTKRGGGTVQPDFVYLAVGLQVLVTSNLDTDNDIANGTKATIVDIVLQPHTSLQRQPNGIYEIATPPLYILVKLHRTRAPPLDGLDAGIVPIEPVTTTFRINTIQNGKSKSQTVKRTQLPITPAYACTDYRSQGQTIPAAIVDVATPPTGGLNLFNLYVALSRSAGRDTIRLLRDFEDRIFTAHHSLDLIDEDDRQTRLNAKTREWWNQLNSESRT